MNKNNCISEGGMVYPDEPGIGGYASPSNREAKSSPVDWNPDGSAICNDISDGKDAEL